MARFYTALAPDHRGAGGHQPDVPGSPLNGPTTRLVTQPP